MPHKNRPVWRWCNQPADNARNLVRTEGFYEHPACAPSGAYQQVEAVSFPGIKTRPQPQQPAPTTDHEAEPDYLLDPDPYPGPPTLTTALFCADCGMFPPIPGSDECKYCAGEFEEWLSQQEAAEPELAERRVEKTRYLVTTYQLIEVA
jgi:hypothetical protein